jgi:predicted phosphodiesterase
MAKTATPEQRKQIAELYRLYMADGLSQSESIKRLAANLGRSADGIREILKREGIELIPSRRSTKVFENKPEPNESPYPQEGEAEDPEFDAQQKRLREEAAKAGKPLNLVDYFTFDGCENLLELTDELQFVEIGRFSNQIESLASKDHIQRCRVVLPETSEDFEIKPAVVRNFEKFHEAERYPLEKEERWLILPDTQIPYHDQKSLDAVLSYASEIHWDGIIQLGDFMDWDFISRWSKENARKIEGQRFLEEYFHGNAVLDQIQTAVRNQNKDAHIVIIEGNHDWRVENVIDQTPALEGLIEMERNLRLAERNITYWRYWTHRKPFIIGKAWFIHGEYIGTHHAKKMAESFHRNVFYGHTHDVMSYTKTTAWGDSIMCSSLGTLSVLDLEYMGHRPSNWQQAFAEFFFQSNGNFNHYVTNIVENEFVAINGRKYKG